MFGRGNWAVIGLDPDSLDGFRAGLDTDLRLLRSSQLMAAAAIRLHASAAAWGVNPYGSPRLDEEFEKSFPFGDLVSLLKDIEEERTTTLDMGPLREFLPSERSTSLGNNAYGFWMVVNDPKDVTDPVSKKEALSYRLIGRPFRFLAKKEKDDIEQQVDASAVRSRRQFPVIADFQHGHLYAESTSKDDLIALRDVLDGLGAKTSSLYWHFGSENWVSEFLNTVYKGNRYPSEMRSRAEELSRFRPEEVEKLPDKEMEKVVAAYFAFTPMENGLVSALGCPSQVRIHRVSDPVGVATSSVAFSLLGLTNDSELAGASLTVLEPVSKRVKGVDKVTNRPQLSVDIIPGINNFDAGAALLKGLELPKFKRHVKAALKAQGGLEVKDFWAIWLTDMHDAVLTLSDSITSILGTLGPNVPGFYGLAHMDTGADTTAVEIEEEPPLSSPPQPSLPEFIPARAETVGGVDPASGPDRTVIIEMVQDESGVFKAESKEEIQHGGD
jgi:hypothetical protein